MDRKGLSSLWVDSDSFAYFRKSVYFILESLFTDFIVAVCIYLWNIYFFVTIL